MRIRDLVHADRTCPSSLSLQEMSEYMTLPGAPSQCSDLCDRMLDKLRGLHKLVEYALHGRMGFATEQQHADFAARLILDMAFIYHLLTEAGQKLDPFPYDSFTDQLLPVRPRRGELSSGL